MLTEKRMQETSSYTNVPFYNSDGSKRPLSDVLYDMHKVFNTLMKSFEDIENDFTARIREVEEALLEELKKEKI